MKELSREHKAFKKRIKKLKAKNDITQETLDKSFPLKIKNYW